MSAEIFSSDRKCDLRDAMLAYAEPEPTDEVLDLREHLAQSEAENKKLRIENQQLRVELAIRDQRIAELEAQVAALMKRVFGKKSEKMPRTKKLIEQQDGTKPDPEKAKQRRKRRDDLRKQKATEVEIKHELPEAERHCPTCPNQNLKFAGQKKNKLWEFVPAHFELQIHIQDTWACPCCDYVVSAPGADRPTEGGQYGSGFMSHVVVSKCTDSIPLYRMEKQFERMGIPMARSTLCDLFHQAAGILEPLYRAMQLFVLNSLLVLADETPLPVLDKDKTRKGYIWTFLTDDVAYYRFSPTRSGSTPEEVLGDSVGTLLVDGYTGYNSVTTLEGRDRSGCWAHVRRKFFDAQKTAPPEAKHMLAEILELYRIEYEAVQRDLIGKPIHTQLRQQRASPILGRIQIWLEEQRPLHLPKSPFGQAITYTLNQWKYLLHYLSDGNIPIDNNLSERRLRIIALGRKNYLFAGNDAAAQNLAILQSIVVTCEMHGVNPETYLTDVLNRVQKHQNSQITDLLPHRWKELFAPQIPNSLFERV